MARPNQEAIDTFMSITGVSETTAIQKLEEHGGDLNEAVNAHFNQGDSNRIHAAPLAAAPDEDAMEIDDPITEEFRGPPFSVLSSSRSPNPFSLLDPNFTRSMFDTDLTSRAPFVSHPRQVREIPIEVKDGDGQSGHSRNAPIIEDVTDTEQTHGPETRGTVIVDDDDDEVVPSPLSTHAARHRDRTNDVIFDGDSTAAFSRPSAPGDNVLPDYTNDIEEEMVRAAIEASKRDAEMSNQQLDVNNDLRDPTPQPRQSHLEDAQLAHAVSLSLKTAEQEKAIHELGSKAISEPEGYKPAEEDERGKSITSNGRQFRSEVGSSSVPDEAEDLEEEPLVWRRRKPISSGSETAQDIEEHVVSPLSSPRQHDNLNHSLRNGADFPSDEWGGISSLEHDEAVMLEAALFGGIPEGSGYRLPNAPHQLMQNGVEGPMGPYQWRMPRPPSPSLVAQRLLREQQDDEYHAALQADREKELKAKEEAEAALEEKRQEEEESRRKAEEEKEMERQLAAKEASLPQEPTADNENAVNLVVRMPDGSRRGRRFLKSDRLQYLFDYIDVGRAVKPGTYRLVRPYPRRAFSDGESVLSLDELGLSSKQEALYLEMI
ncbi:PREDICTED: plant UBX domain-containing protein 8-like isoform X1 [Nicotiana attenuata]|uniref:Plant ubx domain-containing protein 8 n=1 Tax=Nicotiana attenuata TaxID=49451 RepID=A0A1J6KG92_NICAT|nr:PREDICTED: plant UBX domain-containing protein 8-like isoform X1 [Nicotiana attenuata]OIT21827.1 plant ubx domain-containing protein 8 [Nicotiana attenuata]